MCIGNSLAVVDKNRHWRLLLLSMCGQKNMHFQLSMSNRQSVLVFARVASSMQACGGGRGEGDRRQMFLWLLIPSNSNVSCNSLRSKGQMLFFPGLVLDLLASNVTNIETHSKATSCKHQCWAVLQFSYQYVVC